MATGLYFLVLLSGETGHWAYGVLHNMARALWCVTGIVTHNFYAFMTL